MTSVASLLLVLHFLGAVQQPTIAPGDSYVSGRVIELNSGRPVPKAVMMLTTVDLKSSLVTETDANGRYAFDAIAPGDYRVAAQHPDFVPQIFGVVDIRDIRLTVATLDGIVTVERKQTRANVNFALARGGSISGRITSHDGQPLKDAQVTIMSVATSQGTQRMIGSAGAARTNTNGQYEIANVPEGSYVVMAMWIDRQSPSAGVAPLEYRPTLFPGTERQTEATVLKVTSGDSHRNIDFSFAPSDLLRISGHVVRENSQGRIQAYLLSSANAVRTVTIADDGAFSIGIKPGPYTLVARTDGEDRTEAAWMGLDVASDMNGLVLGLSATGVISGRVVAADNSTVPEGFYLAAILAKDGREIDPLPRDRVAVLGDGTFVFSGMFGERIVRTGLGDAWTVDRILVGKTTVPSVTVQPGQRVDDVVIVLTRR